MRTLTKDALSALGVLATVVAGGGAILWATAEGRYPLFDTIYFALTTVTTVGYGELPEMRDYPQRLIAMALIICGVGAIAFFQSTLTALFVEGALARAYRRRRMDKRIGSLENHTIVCGCGRTGHWVVEELFHTARPFVIVDRSEEELERLNELHAGRVLYVVGDATDDRTLLEAGIERASGLVAALTEDPDNLFVVVSARGLNQNIRIVAKVLEVENEKKMIKAGAERTVSPHRIGGLRLVSELVRPTVTTFLDHMMRGGPGSSTLRFEDVTVGDGSEYLGLSLKQAPIRQEANALVVAVRDPDGEFHYNPSPDHVLRKGAQLIVIAEGGGVERLKKLMASP